MGIIRKSIFGAQLFVGLPPVVQFRSDTERGTYQTKLLRQAIERQGAGAYAKNQQFGDFHQPAQEFQAVILDFPPVFGSSPVEDSFLKSLEAPSSTSRGWKDCPVEPGLERFWTKDKWTSMLRPKSEHQ